jgi:hypothetical protein
MQLVTYLINKGIAGFLDSHKEFLRRIEDLNSSSEILNDKGEISNIHSSGLVKIRLELDGLLKKEHITRIYEVWILSYQEVLKD